MADSSALETSPFSMVSGMVTCLVITDATASPELLQELLGQHENGSLVAKPNAVCFCFTSTTRATKFGVEAVIQHGNRLRAGICTAEVDTELEVLGLLDRTLGTATVADYGQVVLSMCSQDLVRDRLPSEYEFDELGTYQLGGSMRAERLYIVRHPQLPIVATELPVPDGPGLSECFVGRAAETDELKEMLVRNRLVTLHGPGGIGKTALARRVLIEVTDDYDSAVWVDVQSLPRESLAVPHLAHLLDAVAHLDERPIDAVLRVIGDRNVLLVIDGAERVAKGLAPIVESLLANCPNLQVLVCTQRKLGAVGEHLMHLKGLEYPLEERDHILIREFDAVGLFIERVQMRDPKFRLTETNAKDVARICERLEGVPLAIEIIATKMAILSPRQILSRLTDQLGFYEDKKRAGNQRHRGLRFAVDWTHDVLSPSAKTLFRRLSLFKGAFSADFATMAAFDDLLKPDDVPSALEELLDVNLIVPVPGDKIEKWFTFVPAIALYAADHLKTAGEFESAKKNYHRWLIAFVDECSANIQHEDQPLWMERTDAVYEDVRETLLGATRTESGRNWLVKILVGFQDYWFQRDANREGLDVLRQLLAAEGMSNIDGFGYLCAVSASLATQFRKFDDAWSFAHTGYRVARDQGNHLHRACNLGGLGNLMYAMKKQRRAARYYDLAAPILRDLKEYRRLHTNRFNLSASLSEQGKYAAALACHQEAERLAPMIDNPESETARLSNVAFLGYQMGDFRLWRDSLVRFGIDGKPYRCLPILAQALLTASKGLVVLGRYPESAIAFGMAIVTFEERGPLSPYETTTIEKSRLMLIEHLSPPELEQFMFEGKQSPLDDRWDLLRNLAE